MVDCIFCKVWNKEIPSQIVDENDHAFAILDINPVSDGHLLIIPKKHYRNFGLTDPEALSSMMRLAKNLTFALEETFPDISGFNYLMNTNQTAGQVVFHTHLHIIPKYEKDLGFVYSAKKEENTLEQVDQVYLKLSTKLKKMKKSRLSKHYLV